MKLEMVSWPPLHLSALPFALRVGFPSLLALLSALAQTPSIVYDYLDLSPTGVSTRLAAINPDGSQDQFLSLNLRNPIYPAWSRDGRFLALAANDPLRPFKWSPDIFVVQAADGQLTKLSALEDTAGAGGFITYYPSYLAVSPDAQNVAAGMVTYVGVRSIEIPENEADEPEGPYDASSRISRCVSLAVFSANGTVFLVGSALCDDDNSHTGEGVDWSPVQNIIAYPYNVTTVFSGAGNAFPITTIHLVEATPYAADEGRRRQLTFPTGYSGFVFDPITLAWHDDFAPAFSPNGQQVAYVRLFTAVTSDGIKQLSTPSIRVVNFDGSNDREVASFQQGSYITRLTWSPDAQQLVFDLGRQAVRQGFPLRTFDRTSVSIAKINLDGSGFGQVRAAPATWPTWRPGIVDPGPTNQIQTTSLSVRLIRDVNPFLVIAWPTPAQTIVLETTTALGTPNWQPVNVPVTSGGGQSSASLPLNSSTGFFRLRGRGLADGGLGVSEVLDNP